MSELQVFHFCFELLLSLKQLPFKSYLELLFLRLLIIINFQLKGFLSFNLFIELDYVNKKAVVLFKLFTFNDDNDGFDNDFEIYYDFYKLRDYS